MYIKTETTQTVIPFEEFSLPFNGKLKASNRWVRLAKIIPSLHYQHPLNTKIVNNAYSDFQDYDSEENLKDDIFALANKIEQDLIDCINENQIDIYYLKM